jgi:hypothetical protein
MLYPFQSWSVLFFLMLNNAIVIVVDATISTATTNIPTTTMRRSTSILPLSLFQQPFMDQSRADSSSSSGSSSSSSFRNYFLYQQQLPYLQQVHDDRPATYSSTLSLRAVTDPTTWNDGDTMSPSFHSWSSFLSSSYIPTTLASVSAAAKKTSNVPLTTATTTAVTAESILSKPETVVPITPPSTSALTIAINIDSRQEDIVGQHNNPIVNFFRGLFRGNSFINNFSSHHRDVNDPLVSKVVSIQPVGDDDTLSDLTSSSISSATMINAAAAATLASNMAFDTASSATYFPTSTIQIDNIDNNENLPLFSSELQQNVSESTIAGSILSAILSSILFFGVQHLLWSIMLIVPTIVYLAITKSVLGQVTRDVGQSTWNIVNSKILQYLSSSTSSSSSFSSMSSSQSKSRQQQQQSLRKTETSQNKLLEDFMEQATLQPTTVHSYELVHHNNNEKILEQPRINEFTSDSTTLLQQLQKLQGMVTVTLQPQSDTQKLETRMAQTPTPPTATTTIPPTTTTSAAAATAAATIVVVEQNQILKSMSQEVAIEIDDIERIKKEIMHREEIRQQQLLIKRATLDIQRRRVREIIKNRQEQQTSLQQQQQQHYLEQYSSLKQNQGISKKHQNFWGTSVTIPQTFVNAATILASKPEYATSNMAEFYDDATFIQRPANIDVMLVNNKDNHNEQDHDKTNDSILTESLQHQFNNWKNKIASMFQFSNQTA